MEELIMGGVGNRVGLGKNNIRVVELVQVREWSIDTSNFREGTHDTSTCNIISFTSLKVIYTHRFLE